MFNWLTPIFFFFLIIIPIEAAEKLKLQVGDIPPPYLGKDTNGDEFNLEAHKGKVVVISFWASWCAPCREELPVLDEFQKQVGKDNLQVVAVNFKESKKIFRRIKKKLSFLKLTITRDKRGSIGRKYGVKGIPHLLIIGRDGLIAYQVVGYGEDSIKKTANIINEQLRKKAG